MNQKDREQLNKLHGEVTVLENALEELKQKAQDLASQFTELSEAEQEKFDKLPEGLAAAEAGEKMQEQADALSSIAGYLEDFEIDSAVEQLNDFPL